MNRDDGLKPIREMLGELSAPLKPVPKPQAARPFTQADQVNALSRGPRSGPGHGLHGAANGAVFAAAHQPRQPASVLARQWPLTAAAAEATAHGCETRCGGSFTPVSGCSTRMSAAKPA